MLGPALVETLPEQLRRGVAGERGRAHGLAEEGRDGLGPGLLQQAVELLERRLAARIEPPRRGREVEVGGEVGRVGLLERSPAGECERAHGRAVVRLGRRDHPPALGPSLLDVVQASQLERGLVGLRSTRDELDARHLGHRHLQQAVGQAFLRFAREVVVVVVGDALGLVRGRGDDLRHPVPETRAIAPPEQASRMRRPSVVESQTPSPRSMLG